MILCVWAWFICFMDAIWHVRIGKMAWNLELAWVIECQSVICKTYNFFYNIAPWRCDEPLRTLRRAFDVETSFILSLGWGHISKRHHDVVFRIVSTWPIEWFEHVLKSLQISLDFYTIKLKALNNIKTPKIYPKP